MKNTESESLYSDFYFGKNVKSSIGAISNRLSRKTNLPYKGRFMFYYATDEEVKKYLEDSKVS